MSTADNSKKQRQKLRTLMLDGGFTLDEIRAEIAAFTRWQHAQPAGPGQPEPGMTQPTAPSVLWYRQVRARRLRNRQHDIEAPIDPDLAAKQALADARREGRLTEHTQPDQPPDSRYRPRHVPAELRGTGATGQTAAAVRRGTTVTAWEHEQRERT